MGIKRNFHDSLVGCCFNTRLCNIEGLLQKSIRSAEDMLLDIDSFCNSWDKEDLEEEDIKALEEINSLKDNLGKLISGIQDLTIPEKVQTHE